MWNDPFAPAEIDEPDDVPSFALAPIAWSDGQLIRLESEWRKAQRAFAYHPFVGISALQGDPPTEYQVDYKVRTLVVDEESGQLQYIDSVSMHLWMPGGFPNQPPLARPMAAVFHPNISSEGVYFGTSWDASESLVDFLKRVGEYLAYRSYDPDAVVNEAAMDWLSENAGMLPLDARADLAPTAGGEPLGRIARYGATTLDQMRRAIDDMRSALTAEKGAPTAEAVRAFADHTRAALGVFLEGDVPESLRETASEFDDWTRELPASVPSWEYVRRQRAGSRAVKASAASLGAATPPLLREVEALEKLVPAPADRAPAAMHQVPSMAALQPRQLKLPNLVKEAERLVETLKAQLAVLSTPAPPLAVRPDGPVGRRLTAQLEDAATVTTSAHQAAAEAMSKFRPVLSRAKAEAQALERIVGWREYIDSFAQGIALERRLKEQGSAGVQAFFLESSAGRFGPFQLEEPVELGAARVAVRNQLQQEIEVIDTVAHASMGRALTGALTVELPLPEDQGSYPATFQLTERCDDTLMQLDFIGRQTGEALKRLQSEQAGGLAAHSWCGLMLALFAGFPAQHALREEHRRAAHRWKVLIADLTALSRFKERLATYHLVHRMSEAVPRLIETLNDHRGKLKESTQRASAIASKCSRDVDTDRLIVPPKYAKAYTEELRFRDHTKDEIKRIEALLKTLGNELRVRLSTPRLCGREEDPAPHLLPPLPQAILDLQADLADEALAEKVTVLEEQLRVELPMNLPPPLARRAVARPATPMATKAPDGAVHEDEHPGTGAVAAQPMPVGHDAGLVEMEGSDDGIPETEEAASAVENMFFIDDTPDVGEDLTDDMSHEDLMPDEGHAPA